MLRRQEEESPEGFVDIRGDLVKHASEPDGSF